MVCVVLEGQFFDEDCCWCKLFDYYFNCICDCDIYFDWILNEFDVFKLIDKMIVVFIVDYGELGGSYQMYGKGVFVYKEQIYVLMIIFYLVYFGNKKCQVLICYFDIVLILVGLIGLLEEKQYQVLGNCKGVNFSGLLKNLEGVVVNVVRNVSLYCYGMILYIDVYYFYCVIVL